MANLSGGRVEALDTSIVQAEGPELPEISGLVDKRSGEDYIAHLKELASARQQTEADTGIALSEIPVEIEGLHGPGESQLREARRLIEEERFADALQRVEEALSEIVVVISESPGRHEALYHEALYLKALGQHRLTDPEAALGTLGELRRAGPGSMLRTRAGVLREEIRGLMMPVVLLQQLAYMVDGKTDAAIARLRSLCELDPEMPTYHYMLAGTLMTAGRLEEAARAADDGVRLCSTGDGEPAPRGGLVTDQAVTASLATAQAEEREDLAALRRIRRQIRRHLLLKEMEPARRRYRKGKFGKARSDLARVDATYRQDPVWTMFDRYLADLDARGIRFDRDGGVGSVPIGGSPEDLDALHFFLVGEEVGKAKVLLVRGRPDEAEREIDAAIRYAPHFPYAHFLKARSLYERLGMQLAGGAPPALEDAISQLEQARERARFAMRDPDLKDRGLLEAIEEGLSAMRGIEEELRRRAEEAKRLNPLIEEFQSIMSSAQGGIGSPGKFEEIERRLKELGNRAASIKGLKSEQAQEALSQLKKVVKDNSAQLEKIRPQLAEAKVVRSLQDEFMSIMGSASGGVSRSDLPRIQSDLEALAKRTMEAHFGASPGAREALSQLLQAITRNLEQVKGLMGGW